MQASEYIVDRLLPSIVSDVCAQRGISVAFYSDRWVARLQKDSQVSMILGYRFDLNPSAASSVAQDKVAASQLLLDAGIPAVPHSLVRSVASQALPIQQLRQQFLDMPVVVKPLSGTGGRGVQLFPSINTALTTIQESPEPAWAISKYIDIRTESRLIILDDQVLVAYEKTQPITRDGMSFYNLGLGAVAADYTPNAAESTLAVTAVRELGLRLAAVDIVTTASGDRTVLEVNDGIMMENYALQSLEHKKRAVAAYDAILGTLFA